MSTYLINCSHHLDKAVSVMATTAGTFQERLLAGALHFSAVHDVPDSPCELKEGFDAIQAALTNGRTYGTTIAQMSDDEARDLIDKLCDLSEEIHMMLRT
jgi:hypothetical protein